MLIIWQSTLSTTKLNSTNISHLHIYPLNRTIKLKSVAKGNLVPNCQIQFPYNYYKIPFSVFCAQYKALVSLVALFSDPSFDQRAFGSSVSACTSLHCSTPVSSEPQYPTHRGRYSDQTRWRGRQVSSYSCPSAWLPWSGAG